MTLLKLEAIKWVKELRSKFRIGPLNPDGAKVSNEDESIELNNKNPKFIIEEEDNNVTNWIKHFFNITEEDLK